MTQNQLSFATLEESKRHNAAEEMLKQEQNALNKKANKETAKHYERQDAINKAHYERSDSSGALSAQASMVSANASALNAQTNQSKYKMEYDIEYGWTGDKGFPEGMPLTAQRKNLELYQMAEEFPYNVGIKKAEAQQKTSQALNSLVSMVTGKGGVWGIISDVLDIKSAKDQYIDPQNYYQVGNELIYVGP